MRRLALLALLGMGVLSACGADGGAEPVPDPTTTAQPTTTSSSPPLTDEAPTTTVVSSSAVVRIGAARYDLVARCAAPGAGEVQVSLSGTDVNGEEVAGYVQAFLGEPYIGLQVGEGDGAVLFESRLDEALEFAFANDILTFTDVDFVSELDLDTGAFTPAGIGSVAVECRSYDRRLPPSAIG